MSTNIQHSAENGRSDISIPGQNAILQRIYDTSPAAYLIVAEDGVILEHSVQLERLCGSHDEGTFVGKQLKFLVPPEQRRKVSAFLQNPINQTRSVEKFQCKKAGGGCFESEFSFTTLDLPEEDRKAFIVTIHDISARLRKNRTTNAIFEIAEAAYKVNSLDEFYTSVHKIVGSLMPADNFFIALYDKYDGLVSFPYYVDEFEFPGQAMSLPPEKLGKSLTMYLINLGEPLFLTDEETNRLTDEGVIDLIGENSLDWHGVPLKTPEGEIIGAIVVQTYHEEKRLRREDTELLLFISTQIAQAIQNRRMMQQVEESEKRYRRMFEDSSLGIFHTTLDGRFETLNKSMAQIFGFDEPQEVIEYYSDLSRDLYVSAEQRKSILERVDNTPDGRIIYEADFYKKDNSIITCRVILRKVYRPEDDIYMLEGFVEDITLRKIERERLKFSNMILEKAGTLVLVADRRGRITYAGPAIKTILGYEPDEMLGYGYWIKSRGLLPDVFDEDSIPGMGPDGQLKVNEYPYERPLRDADGNVRWILWQDAEGENDSIIGIGQDITDRKNAEEALKSSKKKLDFHIQQTPLGYIEWSNDKIILDWNPGAETIFGYTKAEAMGRSAFETIVAEEHQPEIESVFDRVITNSGGRINTNQNITKDGDHIICEWHNTPMRNESGAVTGVISICQDVTDRIKQEEQIQQYTNELKELNSSKDMFFSIIAHDLKGPFTALLSSSQILNEDIEELEPDEISRFASSIYQSARSVLNLLDNLLQWSRIQTGRIEFQPGNIFLDELLDEMIGVYKLNASRKSIQLKVDVPKKTAVYADGEMVKTVLRNLVSNAIKFTSHGGDVEISAAPIEDLVSVSVTDNGVGMSEASLKKLFRIDEHHTTPGTDDEKGTGLGLILCKEFVEQNGGKIHVESTVGQGTTFHFTLPMYRKNG